MPSFKLTQETPNFTGTLTFTYTVSPNSKKLEVHQQGKDGQGKPINNLLQDLSDQLWIGKIDEADCHLIWNNIPPGMGEVIKVSNGNNNTVVFHTLAGHPDNNNIWLKIDPPHEQRYLAIWQSYAAKLPDDNSKKIKKIYAKYKDKGIRLDAAIREADNFKKSVKQQLASISQELTDIGAKIAFLPKSTLFKRQDKITNDELNQLKDKIPHLEINIYKYLESLRLHYQQLQVAIEELRDNSSGLDDKRKEEIKKEIDALIVIQKQIQQKIKIAKNNLKLLRELQDQIDARLLANLGNLKEQTVAFQQEKLPYDLSDKKFSVDLSQAGYYVVPKGDLTKFMQKVPQQSNISNPVQLYTDETEVELSELQDNVIVKSVGNGGLIIQSENRVELVRVPPVVSDEKAKSAIDRYVKFIDAAIEMVQMHVNAKQSLPLIQGGDPIEREILAKVYMAMTGKEAKGHALSKNRVLEKNTYRKDKMIDDFADSDPTKLSVKAIREYIDRKTDSIAYQIMHTSSATDTILSARP